MNYIKNQKSGLKPISLFQKLSKFQKLIIVLVLVVLICTSLYLWHRESINLKQDLSTNTKNSSLENQMTKTGDTTKELTGLSGTQTKQISRLNYPSILTNHKSNPNIGFNLALNQNESNAVYGFDRKNMVMKKLYNYLQLPYKATNTVTKVSNNFILQNFQLDPESNQTFTQVSWTYFDNTKVENQKDYLGEIPLAYTNTGGSDQNKAIDENVIWYGFSNHTTSEENNALPTKDSDYGKLDYINMGVYIYTKSLKNDVGTYLKDLKNNLEFKISDQYCSFVTFSKTDFWCLNDQNKVINLTTNTEIGEYSKIVVTDQGKIFAVKNIDDQYSSIDEITFDDSGNPNTKPNIYQTKQGEIITYISYTNQQELLIQVNRSQSPDFLAAIQKGENIKELFTLQLQEKGDQINAISRSEFDQFSVIF